MGFALILAAGIIPGSSSTANSRHLKLSPAPPSPTALLEDMANPGEAIPFGLSERISWSRHGRINLGNHPGKYRFILPWAQIMAGPGNLRSSAKIQISHILLYLVMDDESSWQPISGSPCVEGGYYSLEYRNGHSTTLNVSRKNGRCQIVAQAGFASHFWPDRGRVELPAGRIRGISVLVRARLVGDNSNKSRYLLSAGADYWLNRNATWDRFTTNGDIGIGRFKWITREWRWFTMNTVGNSIYHLPITEIN